VLVEAVKRLQADYGLKPDGVIGPDTLDALNRGPADRARRLAVGMERLRWTERNPPQTRIDVNTAATFLDYWRDGQPVERRRVVTGEPGWETPQLQSPMVRLVANPIWRVPDSIWDEELSKKSSAYLAANHMTFRDGKLIQLPGPKNSLGQVKFDMENDQHIYLHDTPAKALFADPERHRSHGCVRVEGALDFAMQLASENGVAFDLQERLASGDERFTKLKRAIPVRLLYRTAYFDGGVVRLVPDIYGWDDPIAAKLGLGAVPPRRRGPGHLGVDVGP
jgi:murein L,D-transpeptidase YcbB/YkuD